jgi:serine/threonine protein kinase, bacterial
MTNLDVGMSGRLSNRYQVLSVLGDGGFGKTFLVEDTQMPSGRKCVLKQLKLTHDQPQILQMVQERFQREAAILERLGESHDQIPQLYAYFSEGDQFYLVEEWIEGDTLTRKVEQDGTLSETMVRSILMNLLPAIAYIHQKQIVHRDIKPDNIILRKSDFSPVLIDFGAVKETLTTAVNSQGNTTHSIVVGTPGYMPSEQLAGRPVFASDLYSLGLTAIYLLTGKQPQQLDSDPLTGNILWQSYAPNVSVGFAEFLNRSIHMNVGQRFATVQEMLAALTAGVAGLPSQPHVPSYPQPAPTVISAPVAAPHYYAGNHSGANHSGVQTQVMAPQSVPSQPMFVQAQPGGGDWKKAVLMGGIIGISILGGAFLLKGQDAADSTAAKPSPSPSVSNQSAPTPSPVAPVPAPAAAQPPVAQPAPQVPVAQIPTAQVPVEQVSGAQPPVMTNSAPPAGVMPTQARVSMDTNATIVSQTSGSKNIRSGPGTKYSVQHVAYPGDRVRIVESSQDVGGYTWYKVYFPKSGAEGWIAAQLISRD